MTHVSIDSSSSQQQTLKIQQERDRTDFLKIQQESNDLLKIQQEREREKAERARVRVVRDSLRAINCARAVFLKR